MGIEKEINHTEAKYKHALDMLGKYKESGHELVSLNPEDIELIHDEMVAKYGGIQGIRDNNLFLSVCQAPYQTFFGDDLYPSLYDKAAKYLADFTRYQIFLDGNKRTGLAVACVFLQINSCEMDLTESEAYDLVMDIANNRITEIGDIARILEEKSYMIEKDAEGIDR